MTEFKETDLYEPIRAFLEEEGYQVQAEVKHCDIAAEKNGRLVVVELKRAFGLKLVYQGLERQSLTDEVFVAIPRPKKGAREKAWQDMLRLLKRLELGLLTVALDSPLKTVDVVLTPADSMIRKNKRKKERLQAAYDAFKARGAGRQTARCKYRRHDKTKNYHCLSGKGHPSGVYSGARRGNFSGGAARKGLRRAGCASQPQL